MINFDAYETHFFYLDTISKFYEFQECCLPQIYSIRELRKADISWDMDGRAKAKAREKVMLLNFRPKK